jgi:hypothetical protein
MKLVKWTEEEDKMLQDVIDNPATCHKGRVKRASVLHLFPNHTKSAISARVFKLRHPGHPKYQSKGDKIPHKCQDNFDVFMEQAMVGLVKAGEYHVHQLKEVRTSLSYYKQKYEDLKRVFEVKG